jgi:hypothetical protein
LPDVIEQLKTNLTASHKGKFSPIFFDSWTQSSIKL